MGKDRLSIRVSVKVCAKRFSFVLVRAVTILPIGCCFDVQAFLIIRLDSLGELVTPRSSQQPILILGYLHAQEVVKEEVRDSAAATRIDHNISRFPAV